MVGFVSVELSKIVWTNVLPTQVINIITKGFRSKPIVSINKKMSARIRATRKTLAKDAIALRELVNQIRIAKAKTKASFTDVNSIKI